MRTLLNKLWLIQLVLAILISPGPAFVGPAEAQELFGSTTVAVNVAARFVPASGLGLVLVPDGVIQKTEPKIDRISPDYVIVSFTVSRSEIARDSMATAVVMSDSGDVAFGDVKPLIPPLERSSFFTIPDCPTPQRDPTTLVNDAGLLESLVSIRAQRREANKKKLSALIDPSFQAKLSRAESIFGLSHEAPMTADLPPHELVDRASRLLQAVKNLDLATDGPIVPEQYRIK